MRFALELQELPGPQRGSAQRAPSTNSWVFCFSTWSLGVC
jgi:hypothetical protein